MTIADVRLFDGIEDIQNTETVDSLYTRYIVPIDRIRSIVKPSPFASTDKLNGIAPLFWDLEYSKNKMYESRCHAFYRMIGLPIVNSDASGFYNPGFNPNVKNLDSQRLDIVTNQSEDNKISSNTRELTASVRASVFSRQDLASSLYALLLRYTGPFQVLNEDGTPFKPDPQQFTISDRQTQSNLYIAGATNKDFINIIEQYAAGFVQNTHILRPFIVDPNIELTVSPDTSKVCVPFLATKTDTKINNTTYLMRPGIEYIIRSRLSSQVNQTDFGKNLIKNYLDYFNQDEDYLDLFETLNGERKELIQDDLESLFGSPDAKQIETVTKLLKSIKKCIRELAIACRAIDAVKEQIGWVPVCSKMGPETGRSGAKLSPVGINKNKSETDTRIVALRAKKALAERKLNDTKDVGDFASPFYGSVSGEDLSSFDNEISNETQKRDSFASVGFEAMGIVEKVTGEVSGLGLVDILSIYLALWTIDIETLINLIDEGAFARLYDNNLEFRGVPEVSARHGGSTIDIETVIGKFEEKLIYIFKFCDKLLADEISSPANQSGGSV